MGEIFHFRIKAWSIVSELFLFLLALLTIAIVFIVNYIILSMQLKVYIRFQLLIFDFFLINFLLFLFHFRINNQINLYTQSFFDNDLFLTFDEILWNDRQFVWSIRNSFTIQLDEVILIFIADDFNYSASLRQDKVIILLEKIGKLLRPCLRILNQIVSYCGSAMYEAEDVIDEIHWLAVFDSIALMNVKHTVNNINYIITD